MKTFTKLFALLFAFTIISSMSMNAQFSDPNGDPSKPLLEIWVYGLDGVTWQAGDQIAAYDGDVCVGMLELTVDPDETNWMSSHLIAYAYDMNGNTLYTPGNPLQIRYYDVNGKVSSGAGIVFHDTWYAPVTEPYYPVFGAYGYCYVDLSFVTKTDAATLNVEVFKSDGIGGWDELTDTDATVACGGVSLTWDAVDDQYEGAIFAGLSGAEDYSYTVTITATGYTTETYIETFNPYDEIVDVDVWLDATSDVTSTVQAYDLVTDSWLEVEDAVVTTTIEGVVYTVDTDANGVFLLEDVPDGSWVLTVSYPAHTTQEVPVTVVYDGTVTIADPIQLPYIKGTIEGDIFNALTLNMVTEVVYVEIWTHDRQNKLTGTDATRYSPVEEFTGDYSIYAIAGTYDIKIIEKSTSVYDVLWIDDHTFYPGANEILNINLVTNGYGTHWGEITGNPNKMWSIHIEFAKFGDNFLLPWDEIAIFDTDGGPVGSGALRVGTVHLPATGIWQNAGSNVIKAFAEFSNGDPGFAEGHTMEFYGYDVSNSRVYEEPLSWSFNSTIGTYSDTVFPDPLGNHISYLTITWAGSPGTLAGTITDDATGGATVEVINFFTQDVIETTTTAGDGTYSISLDEGTYLVRVSKDGFITYLTDFIDAVVIEEDATTTFSYVLVAKTPVTRNYDYPVGGYYFFGRDYYLDPAESSDMLAAFSTNYDNTFGGGDYQNCWFENDTPLRYDYSSGWQNPFNWELLEGYQFFADYLSLPVPTGGPYSFSHTEYMVDPADHPIEFSSAGIYYIPYFPGDATNVDDAMTAFASILGDLDWVMDSEGNRLHHDGGGWIDNIGMMSPTEGYKIKMNDAADLYYPVATKKSARIMEMVPEHFVYTGGNAADWTYTLYIETSDFEIGDEIAAYSNGVMVGSMVIDSDDPWENDLNTFYQSVSGGYYVNTPIELMAWDVSEGLEYEVDYEMVNINSGCYYGVKFPAGLDHFSYVKAARGVVDVDENQVENNVKVYPNPTSGVLNIESVSNINELYIYNIYGAMVSTASVNAKQQYMDVSNLTPGTYMIQLHTDTGVITKRVIIK